MSRLLALLAQTGTAAAPPPPGEQPPPPGTVVDPDALPTITDDALVETMRPTGQRLTLFRVGPGRDYATVREAITAGRNLQEVTWTAAGLTGPTRDMRVDIVIDPGDYPETASGGSIGVGTHMALYAADGNKRSVRIRAGADMSLGWTYYEGIIWDPSASTGPKYGVHHAGGGTSIFARCHLYYSLSELGSGWPMGMDGYGHGFTLMYDTHFTGGAAGTRTNNHAASGTTTVPETMVYVGCVFTNGGLEFNPMGSPAAHELWAVDNTAQWVGVDAGAGATFYGDGNTMTDTTPWPAYRKVPDVVSRAWPVPTGGLSPYWRTQLGL